MPFTFLPLALFNSSLPVYKRSQSRWPEDWVLFETPVRISDVDGDRKEERPQSLEEEQGTVETAQRSAEGSRGLGHWRWCE